MINRETSLQELQAQVRRQKQLRAQLSDLETQRAELAEREKKLAAERAAEDEDVEHLEAGSLRSFFYHMTGSFDERLDKERREAYASAVKHDAVRAELEAAEDRIGRTQRELEELNGCERQYAQALEEKLLEVRETDPINGPALARLDERAADLEGQRKEIAEAVSAGKAALSMADTVLSSLSSAAGWGTWDLFGGGLLADMAKHSHLDEAQRNVEQLQVRLGNFRTELADVSIGADIQIQIDGFLRFADFFFDGIFADWAVQNKINESETRVRETRNKIQNVLDRLGIMMERTEAELEKLKAEQEAVIARVTG